MPWPGPVPRDVLATFEDVRSRAFTRLDGLTDAEYLRGYLSFFDDDHPGGDPQEWPGTAAGTTAAGAGRGAPAG